MTDYYILDQADDPRYCAIYDMPADLPESHRPADGIEVGATSYDYVFDMSPDVTGIAVPDLINNALGYVLVSARLKGWLEQHSRARTEFIPFRLRNHKGRFVDQPLFIANVLGAPDVVDTVRTVGDPDPVNPGRFMYVERVFLDPQRLTPELDLFRLSIRPQYLVVRADLKQRLEAGGLTGAVFHRVGDEVSLG